MKEVQGDEQPSNISFFYVPLFLVHTVSTEGMDIHLRFHQLKLIPVLGGYGRNFSFVGRQDERIFKRILKLTA